ncbi:MAG: HPr family phosphocarrier protein [Cellulomonadaceae bacterium]|jgi:PTS hybrid protein|nr:HPr family phosphocarrier protein [Cellulomonadaceae bacterium]
MTVALVLVAHSARLAEGAAELAGQMAPGVHLGAAGGLPDGSLGTSLDTVQDAVEAALAGAEGVLVIGDLGSALLTVETAIDLNDAWRGQVVLARAPFVEGAVAGAVAAEMGWPLDKVVDAAQSAGDNFTTNAVAYPSGNLDPGQAALDEASELDAMANGIAFNETAPEPVPGVSTAAHDSSLAQPPEELVPSPAPEPVPAVEPIPAVEPAPQGASVETPDADATATATVTLVNKLGLHARPCAVLARTIAETGVPVTINGVDGTSVLLLLMLSATGGDLLTVSASGPGAQEAVNTVVALVETGFNEG